MVLHCEYAQSTAAAVAGTAIAAASFIGADGEIDDIEGQWPILRELITIDGGAAGVFVDVTPCISRVELQPTNWATSDRLIDFSDAIVTTSIATEATTPLFTMGGGAGNKFYFSGSMHQVLAPNTNWVSGDSKFFSSVAASNIGVILAYQYGQALPYNGGKLHWVQKAADAAPATANVWDNAFTSKLTSVGLDPTKSYILRGIGVKSATADKATMAVRIYREVGAQKMIGIGAADAGLTLTVYTHDGIPCSGNDSFIVETLDSVVDTAAQTIWMCFEELGGTVSNTISTPGTSFSPFGGGTPGTSNLGGLLSGLFGGR
jgi:hypothetical protein